MTISYKPKFIEITVNNNKYELDSEDILFIIQIMDTKFFEGEKEMMLSKMREMSTLTQISILKRINKLSKLQTEIEQELEDSDEEE